MTRDLNEKTGVYAESDKICYELLLRVARLFNQSQRRINRSTSTLAAFDELNVLFDEVDTQARAAYLEALTAAYDSLAKKKRRKRFDDEYIEEVLGFYDGMCEYVYIKEFERNREKLIEQVATVIERHNDGRERTDEDGNKIPIVSDLKRIFNGMFNKISLMIQQFFIRFTDEGRRTAMMDNSVKNVRWNAEHDERTCEYCMSLDGVVFPIDKIPDKPHLRCRCWVTPED